MKPLQYYLIIMLLMSFSAKSQRMLPKQKAIEVNAGFLLNDLRTENYFISVGMTIQAGKGNYNFFGIEYLRESENYKISTIPIETYLAEAGYSFNLISDRKKNILFNFSLSAAAGFQNINRRQNFLFDGALILSESNFVYGAGGKISTEIYISDRIILIPHIKAKVLWNSSRNLLIQSAGFGIRINL